MADFISKVVAPTLVKEGVNRAVSFVFGKGEEQAPSQEHNAERLKMAVSALELALERTGKLPITDMSLIRRWHVFKQAYIEGRDLLTKQIQRKEEIEQRVKRKRWNIPTRAKNIFVSSPAGGAGLSTDDVRRFAWLADCADKFVRDVESGCSLRHYTFCSPLVRHLLQGKTFWSEIDEGNRLRRFYMRPICFEGRGVETLLGYHYDDREMAEKGFGLNMVLRLSESTDIVGTTIKCLQSITSQYKQVNQTAMGELTLLANLQDTSHDSPSSEGIQNLRKYSQIFRPDPVCCKGDGRGPCANNIVSPRLSHTFPEQVIYFGYHFCVPAPEYRLRSSSADQAAKSLMKSRRQPLGMRVAFLHYLVINKQQDSCTLDITSRENNHELRFDNIQQVTAEMGSSCTTNCFLLQPKLTGNHISWFSRHGLACFHSIKPSTERAVASNTSLIRSKTAKKRKEKAAGN